MPQYSGRSRCTSRRSATADRAWAGVVAPSGLHAARSARRVCGSPTSRLRAAARYPAIAVATILAGQCDYVVGERFIIIRSARHLALRRPALWAEEMRRFLAVRDEIGEHRFDIKNDDVVKRPIDTIERIYDHLGMSLSSALRSRLKDYNTRNAPGSFGSHRYTFEEYGTTDAEIREAFKNYGERFGLWSKAA